MVNKALQRKKGKMKHILIPVIGFLIAPPVGVLTYALMQGGVGAVLSAFVPLAVVISIILGTALGGPIYIYLYLRSKHLISVMSLSIGGAIISMLPWISWIFWELLDDNGNTTVTTAGNIYKIIFLARLGLCGAASGVVFWLIVRSLVTSNGAGHRKPPVGG